jgi:hypothetical protein
MKKRETFITVRTHDEMTVSKIKGRSMKDELPVLKKNVSLIIETDDKAALREVIEAAGGTVTIEYASVDMLAAEVPLSSLEDVMKSPHTVAVHKDKIQKPF